MRQGPRFQSMSLQTEAPPPGHAEIMAASALHPASGAWAFFMREIIGLPHQMTPAVIQVIRLESWKGASDPLEALRVDALQAYGRAWAGPESGLMKTISIAIKSR
jgi:hypothetical protein